MSKRVRQSDHQSSATPDTGFEVLQSTAEFRGPVEPLHGHEQNDHFALIYEEQAEQFATVVPYIQQGLEHGERCVYIVDETSRDDVVTALRDGGVDVDVALDEGQLSIHSVEETYLDGGEFDVNKARAFLQSAMEDALDEYEGFRVTAEETWLVGDETAQREFMNCEAHVNNFLDGEAGMALCQYNRAELPPAVIEDVINTHPYLIYDDTACPNDYYTPPEEYFGPDNPARENERKLETLVERTDVRASLQTRERYERKLYEVTSDPDRSFEEKLDALIDLGRERFNLEIGGLCKVDPDNEQVEVEVIKGDYEDSVGAQFDLADSYCRVATDHHSADTVANPIAVTDPVAEGFEGKLCYEKFDLQAYLGTYLDIEGAANRTFWFASKTQREDGFSEAECTFHHLMSQWVQYELERQHHERALRRTKNQFEAVFEQSNDAIFINDPYADEIVDSNPAGLEMLGYDRDELLACGPSDCHPDEMEQFRAFVDGVFEDGQGWTDELTCLAKDGTAIPAEISASTFELDDRELMLAIVRDITERKEHEQYQRELYDIIADTRASFGEKVENLLELGSERFGIEIGYFTRTTDDGTFEIIEAIGEHDLIQPGVTDSLSHSYCEKLLASSGSVSVTDAAEVGWTDDPAYERFGLDAYFATTVHVEGDEYGTLCFASESPRDQPYTDAERTFLELMGQFVSYELKRNLRETQLEQKSERLESFASMLAHELRNPVNIGQIYSNQLSVDEYAEAVDYVTEAFDRIEDMIDVMLMLTRGRDAVGTQTRVNLGSVTEEAWGDVDAPDATLDCTLDQAIQADETYIRHLVRNLLENAVEHGGSDVTITVGELSTGFYVEDDGVGISAEEREVIFDEGYTTASGNGGTGLGLAFVQKLAEVYDWDYTIAESDAGGARFEFTSVTETHSDTA